ncbi:MAG: hypothetical protein OXS35_06860, partial [Dehalococcoidia bacterium]|nr:hypothetical protein [Dehalococcoidia bacterium]
MKGTIALIIAAAAALVAACSNQPVAEDRPPGDAGGQIEQVVEQADCETFGEFARLETIMANERSSHSALLLEDGMVLVVGGRGKGGARWP